MALNYEFRAQTIIAEGRTTQDDIDQIKDWMSTSNLPQIPDELIVLCLLSCRNVLAATKNTIKAYFRIKKDAPEIFTNRDIDRPELKKITEVANVVSIPTRLPNNTVIHFFTLKDTNYQNFEWIPSMKLAFMLIDISQSSNPPNDLVVALDMKGLGFMHITRLKISAVKKFLEFLQEAMPLKIKTIHILNANYLFDKLISIARIFIKNELMAIIKTHPPGMDMTQFHKDCIPASCLPKEYGGDLPSLEELNESCVQKFRELKEFFQAEEKIIDSYNA